MRLSALLLCSRATYHRARLALCSTWRRLRSCPCSSGSAMAGLGRARGTSGASPLRRSRGCRPALLVNAAPQHPRSFLAEHAHKLADTGVEEDATVPAAAAAGHVKVHRVLHRLGGTRPGASSSSASSTTSTLVPAQWRDDGQRRDWALVGCPARNEANSGVGTRPCASSHARQVVDRDFAGPIAWAREEGEGPVTRSPPRGTPGLCVCARLGSARTNEEPALRGVARRCSYLLILPAPRTGRRRRPLRQHAAHLEGQQLHVAAAVAAKEDPAAVGEGEEAGRPHPPYPGRKAHLAEAVQRSPRRGLRARVGQQVHRPPPCGKGGRAHPRRAPPHRMRWQQ